MDELSTSHLKIFLKESNGVLITTFIDDLLQELSVDSGKPSNQATVSGSSGTIKLSAEKAKELPFTKNLADLMDELKDFQDDTEESDAREPVSKQSTPSVAANTKTAAQLYKPASIGNLQKTGSDIRISSQEKLNEPAASLSKTASNIGANNLNNTRKNLGKCAGCTNAVYSTDMAVNAFGKIYHQNHFQCHSCQKILSGETYFEKNSNPYCEKCMNDNFVLPVCEFCKEKIKGKCVQALEKSWHQEHFFCSHCGQTFPSGATFLEHDGKAYCEDDYYNMFSPKCAKCNEAVFDEVITALGKSFHPECFVCSYPGCNMLLSDAGSFFEHASKPYCEAHYHAVRGSLCFSCQKPITGRCITAMGQKYHPEHFCCSFCKKNLTAMGSNQAASFREHDAKAYCVNCFVKLYG